MSVLVQELARARWHGACKLWSVFRVATFNAGLAVGVLPNVAERVPLILDALARLDVDLLFVQEFWLESHWEALRRALAGVLPHALRPDPVGPRGACTAEQLAPLRACAELHCAGLRDEALARCVVRSCAPVGLALPAPCLNCIASHPHGTLDEILARCLAAATPSAQESSAAGPWLAYGGSFGTGLLVRDAPLETSSLTFESTINARGALFAALRTELCAEPLQVFAAHLSPGGAEQPPQLERLLAWTEEKSRPRAPQLLLGDLNLTPGSALFRRLELAGFRDAGPAQRQPTYSGDALVTGSFGGSGWRLDHVLVRGLDAEFVTRRILDEQVTLNVAGELVRSTLSDHAGVLWYAQ